MRDCNVCEGNGWVLIEKEGEVCYACDGSGKLDGCVCFAREPLECGCGGWDDVDLDDWYGDEE